MKKKRKDKEDRKEEKIERKVRRKQEIGSCEGGGNKINEQPMEKGKGREQEGGKLERGK